MSTSAAYVKVTLDASCSWEKPATSPRARYSGEISLEKWKQAGLITSSILWKRLLGFQKILSTYLSLFLMLSLTIGPVHLLRRVSEEVAELLGE